jgi:hypothetical protein
VPVLLRLFTAEATYRAAVARWPAARIHPAARVVVENWQENWARLPVKQFLLQMKSLVTHPPRESKLIGLIEGSDVLHPAMRKGMTRAPRRERP